MNTTKSNLFIYFILFCISLFFVLQSPLSIFSKNSIGTDSSVFIYSAKQILQGQSMYKDIVDHKGPVLYLINVIGLSIFKGKFIGVWILELFSFYTTSIFLFKLARLFAAKIPSMLSVLTLIFLLSPLFAGGNLTEEWALPFISLALYIFVTNLKCNTPLTLLRLFLLSLTFVLTFLLRANLIAVWAGFGLVLLFKWIVTKNYYELLRNLSYLIFFVLLIILPFFLYFWIDGTLDDAIYLIFEFNMVEYAPKISLFSLQKEAFYLLVGQSQFFSVLPIIGVLFIYFNEKSYLNFAFILTLFFTAIVCSMGYGFEHYFMIFIPLLVFPYAYIFQSISDNIHKLKYPSLIVIFIFYNYIPFRVLKNNVMHNYITQNKFEDISKFIIKNTKPSDKILTTGFGAELYLYSKRNCAIRFPYTLIWSSLVKKNYLSETTKALPRLIIGDSKIGEIDLSILLKKKYKLIFNNSLKINVWCLK